MITVALDPFIYLGITLGVLWFILRQVKRFEKGE